MFAPKSRNTEGGDATKTKGKKGLLTIDVSLNIFTLIKNIPRRKIDLTSDHQYGYKHKYKK